MDLNADAHRDMLPEHHAIVVHEGFRLIHAVRDRAHGGACQALTLREDELDAFRKRLGAIACEELGDAPLPSADGGNLRPEVAHGAVGQSTVSADDSRE